MKPNSAPARVDCTRCETPIAVHANKIPGPNVLRYRYRRSDITKILILIT
ncbi:MAG: Uncharacterised protein [Candidatus Nitrosopelagicus brevis]|nr:MAG: Uncharacterised protein [Candidatus Nitrosopelagicus brevis]